MLAPPNIPILLAVAALMATGAMCDLWAARSRDPEALRLAGSRLPRIPASIGGWRGTDSLLPSDALQVGGISHYVSRSYTRREGGPGVVMTVVCGPSGPISLHPPTACYVGNGYALLQEPRTQSFDSPTGARHELMVAEFGPQGGSPGTRVRIAWGWGTDGRWASPESPRLTFAGEPALYKLYVVEELADVHAPSAVAEFLRESLPVIEDALAASVSAEEAR